MASGLRRLLRRFVTAFRSGQAETDLAREIHAHLQLLEDQFVAQGMTREDARYAAKRAFGGIDQAKELQRDARSFRWLTGWHTDLKLAVRMLVKSPGLTIIGVIALAVAMAAGAMYLEFVRDLIHPTLPANIVGIRVWDLGRNQPQLRALHDFSLWRGRVTTLDDFGAERWVERQPMTADGPIERARGAELSASGFRLFPVPPVIGRTLIDSDEALGAPDVVVIGRDLWQTHFNSDPNILGRTVQIGPATHTVVGVMPEQFSFPVNHNLWVPLKVQTVGLPRGEGSAIQMFGRLQDGVSAETAQAELTAMLTNKGTRWRADVRTYVDSLMTSGRNDQMLLVIVYSVNLVFIMLLGLCGANVATLVFARTATRESEITVRTALGASRARISAQLFAEALVLSSLAAVTGLAAARLGSRWVIDMYADAIGDAQTVPFWWNESLSLETILYAFALAVIAALIVGVIPALKATGAQMQGRLREAGAAASTLKFGRMWTGVIVAQAALTVAFLAAVVAVGWAIYVERSGATVAYQREQFLISRLVVEGNDDSATARQLDAETWRAVAEQLMSEPGVVNVTYATAVPGTMFENFNIQFAESSDGQSLQAEAETRAITDTLWSLSARVGPNFFATLGIPLVSGRLFTDAEIFAGHNVAIVDETFVRSILGGRNPIGVLVREPSVNGAPPGPWYEVVGVVNDITRKRIKRTHDAVLYRPASGAATATARLLIRTASAASPMAHRVQTAARSAHPRARLFGMESLQQFADDEAIALRFFLRVFIVVTAVALLLSTAGIYALVSFTLARRTREIGIRVALGAAPRRIISGTFARAFMQFAGGVLVGAIPSFIILGLGAEDEGGMGELGGLAATFAVGVFVILVAMISCAVPVRRALRIDPMQALRTD